MKPKIVLVSPADPELSRLAEKVIADKGYKNVSIIEEVLEKAVVLSQKLESENVDAIISRGTTGSLIKDALNIPVILIDINNFDLLKVLYDGVQKGYRKFAYFDHISRKGFIDFDSIAKILNISKISLFYYQNLSELEPLIQQASSENLEFAICTGRCVLTLAKKTRLDGALLYSNEDAIDQAFKKAYEILDLLKQEKKLIEMFQAVSNDSNYGVVITDSNGMISYINLLAEKSLDLKSSDVIGKNITTLKIDKEINQILSQQDTIKNKLCKIKNNNIILNRIPLIIRNRHSGYAITLEGIHTILNLEQKVRKELLAKGLTATYRFKDIIGNSPQLLKQIGKAKKFALTDTTVLLYGESGTGKELFAHSIHNEGLRANEAFVAVNCATLPENLLESELFGYVEGAFTGAKKGGKLGLFELAHKGTIFLDEITELSPHLQTGLLRVLQEKVVRRLGGDRIIPVDVRVIAATNCRLEKAVHEKTFRDDLFFRLNVLALEIPPLRERMADIPLLVSFFLSYYSQKAGKNVEPIPNIVINKLKDYNWPGNIRELQNFVQRYVILSEEGKDNLPLLEELFPAGNNEIATQQQEDRVTVKIGSLESMQTQIIKYLINETAMTREDIARKLKISRTTLWKKIK